TAHGPTARRQPSSRGSVRQCTRRLRGVHLGATDLSSLKRRFRTLVGPGRRALRPGVWAKTVPDLKVGGLRPGSSASARRDETGSQAKRGNRARPKKKAAVPRDAPPSVARAVLREDADDHATVLCAVLAVGV